jgi:hypothetical protein
VVSKNINNKRGNIKTGLTVFFKRGCCNNQKNVIFCDRPVLLNLFKRVAVRKPGLYKVNGGGGDYRPGHLKAACHADITCLTS